VNAGVSSTLAVPWLVDYAARKGLRYSPEADERWLRAWEPYATLRVPMRYEHVLESTGDVGSITIARFVVETLAGPASAWIAIAQDTRVGGKAAITNDPSPTFRESLDLVTMPRRATGDAWFDQTFAVFAASAEDLARCIGPRARRLALSWQTPMHAEVRPGGFVLAPVTLGADPASLSWLVRAVHAFGERARG
jgi:hypothetical protein